MTETLVITFPHSREEAEKLSSALGADIALYSEDIFSLAFSQRKRIVALMSIGIVVRQIAPLLKGKWTDPAIVIVSPDLRFAVPLLGGHHGANDLARELAALGMEAVITTATESRGRASVETIARKTGNDIINRDSTRQVNAAILSQDIPVHAVQGPSVVLAGPDVSILVRKGLYSVGIGCRKGVHSDEVAQALRSALAEMNIRPEDVFVYATTEKKISEHGLIDAVRTLSGTLIFLDDNTINAQPGTGPSRAGKIGLLGVAEPCALATARKRTLVMPKKVFGRVTVAIAQ